MQSNEFEHAEQPITDADLDEVERNLHFAFPIEVRRHYLRHNGGSPTNCLYKKHDTIFVVHQFLPVKYGKLRLDGSFRALKIEETILPEHLVPFAIDPGGDYYCFSTRDVDMGSIWIFQGEYFDEPNRAVQFLAKSIGEFVGGLEPDEE